MKSLYQIGSAPQEQVGKAPSTGTFVAYGVGLAAFAGLMVLILPNNRKLSR